MTQYEFVRIDEVDQVGDIIKRWAANGWKVISSSTTFVHHEGSIGSRVRTGLGTGIYTLIVFGKD